MDAAQNSCVMLHDSVSMSLLRVRPMPRYLMRILLALLGICSAFASFLGFFELYVDPPVFYSAVIVTAVVTAIGLRVKKCSWLVYLIGVVALLFCIWRYHAELLFGVEQIANTLSRQVHGDRYSIPRPVSAFGWTGKQCVRFTATVIAVLISFIVTAATVRRPNLPVAFLVTFMLVELGLFYGMKTHSMAIFGLVAYWVSMVVMTEGEKRLSRQRNSAAEFVSSKQVLYAKPTLRFMPTEWMAVLTAGLVLLLGGAAHGWATDYQRSDEMDVLRNDLYTRWDALLEQVTDAVNQIGNSEEDTETLRTEKQLNALGNPKFKNGTAFSFILESESAPGTMYLKQNTYAVYTGSCWTILPDAAYEARDALMQDMQNQKMLPQAPEHSDDYAQEELAVLTYPAEQSVYAKYLPYRACYDENARYIYDTQMLLQDGDAYRFVPFNTSKFAEISLPADTKFPSYNCCTSGEDNELTHSYDDFAGEYYLQLPATGAMNQIRKDAVEVLRASYGNLQEALLAIREYLAENTVYTLTPATIPEGVDYASSFLLETREGYCVHYATAAVLLCRMMGIPARYAEGYVVFEGDFSDPAITTQNGDQYTVNVPDSRAHAWAEVYLPGYGWLPFEFTAGYARDDMTQAERPGGTETPPSAMTTVTTATTSHTTQTEPENSSHMSDTTMSHAMNDGQSAVGIGGGWWKILLVVGGTALAVILYLLLHRGIYARRERRMHDSVPNTAATVSYRYLLRLLAREGIVRDPMQSHEAFALAAEAACPLIARGAMQQAVEIQLAVTFSPRGIAQEQANEMADFVQELVGQLYAKASPLKRFLMRWIFHDII